MTTKHTPATPLPQVGMIVKVRGQNCRIVKVRPFGTLDVATLDGARAYRISGLWF